ncbi:hypothetical protein ABIE50_001236 [Chitinophaga sp. OAE865]
MKKLKLKALGFGANELLSRSQLKNIFGGVDGSGGTSCSASADCGGSRGTISCTGVDYCYGRDGHSVTCSDGAGNPTTTKCF